MNTGDEAQIEQYLRNELSQAERKELEDRFQKEEDLKSYASEAAMLQAAFDNLQAENMLTHFRDLESGAENILKFNVSQLLKWAAALAIVALLGYLALRPQTIQPEELFVAYYSPYPNVEHPVTRSDVANYLAWQYYEQGDYQKALDGFSAMTANQESQQAVAFYSAICFIELNNYSKAIDRLKSLQPDKETKYKVQANWYLALCYLKTKDLASARPVLQVIIDSDTSYKAKALEILKQID